jgi:DNA helicase HerA-like ATPase
MTEMAFHHLIPVFSQKLLKTMTSQMKFTETVKNGYAFKGERFQIGAGMLNEEVFRDAPVFLPLSTMNRHGLIAGATGTGKTKTLQVIAEGLSEAGVPVMLMDIKGDLSGIAAAGEENEKLLERIQKMGISWKPASFPADLLTLSGGEGVKLRATVSEFGPILLSKILGLNDTQEGVVSMLFKYCDDQKLPLLDLKDFVRILQFAAQEGKPELEKSYGRISTTSTGTILRKVIELQQQGADIFFGEPSFEVEDLMRLAPDGKGMISILRVMDMQSKPKLFSTFMLSLLAELYATLPEEGDLEKPKLVLFIDEAHLVFQEATKALLQQIETVVKLIRSKGVGIFFCTQNPQDIPAGVLAQLGLKVQHALRAFTAADRKVIKQVAENYPETDFYETDVLITQLGIGEALITILNEKGIPTPLVHTMLVPPRSRMDVLTMQETSRLNRNSELAHKYETVKDTESAYEILNEKLDDAANRPNSEPEKKKRTVKEKSTLEEVLDNSVTRQIGRTAASVITRSLLGALGLGGTTRRKRKSFF